MQGTDSRSKSSVKKEKATNAFDKWQEGVQAEHEKSQQNEKERKQRTEREHVEFIKKQVEAMSSEPTVQSPQAPSHFMTQAKQTSIEHEEADHQSDETHLTEEPKEDAKPAE